MTKFKLWWLGLGEAWEKIFLEISSSQQGSICGYGQTDRQRDEAQGKTICLPTLTGHKKLTELI